MNSTNEIRNLNDFNNYRTHCPFCNRFLILLENFHIGSITLSEDLDDYVLEYEGVDAFSSQIRLLIQEIRLNKFNNGVRFKLQPENIIAIENRDNCLRHNSIYLSKKCLCENKYSINTSFIGLTSINQTTFSVKLRNESFLIKKENLNLEIDNRYDDNTTIIRVRENYPGKNFSIVLNEEEIPFVKFPYHDKDAIFQKVNFLTTFL